jgi:hypothetical protein
VHGREHRVLVAHPGEMQPACGDDVVRTHDR